MLLRRYQLNFPAAPYKPLRIKADIATILQLTAHSFGFKGFPALRFVFVVTFIDVKLTWKMIQAWLTIDYKPNVHAGVEQSNQRNVSGFSGTYTTGNVHWQR